MGRRLVFALLLCIPAFALRAHALIGVGSRFLGSALTIRWASCAACLSPTATGFHQEASFFHGLRDSLGDEEFAILAIPLGTRTGFHSVGVHWFEGTERCSEILRVRVKSRGKKMGSIHLPARAVQAMASLPAESGILKSAVTLTDRKPAWRGYFQVPLQGARLSQAFGIRRRYEPGGAIWTHKGIDLAAPLGTTVLADNDAVVVLAREDLKSYGGLLVLDHGYQLSSIYMHLAKIWVHPGETVYKGEALALSGEGGISTGPHLHWQMELRGIPIDPLPWIDKEAQHDLE